MEENFIDGKPVSRAEAEAHRQQHFPGECAEVKQPWHSHGAPLQIGGIAYFRGNASDPNDLCGNDQLSMAYLSITPDRPCPADGIMSYILIPEDNVGGPGH
jgi:hypothetical protein